MLHLLLFGLLAVIELGSVFTACSVLPSLKPDESSVDDEASASPALKEFLRRFDKVTSHGFVKTQRAGSTGIGYTLESLLQIKENNSPRGDLLGMEIKAYRESKAADTRKMNLFLKEPRWQDQLRSADRIRKYGYQDVNGRQAWYQSVTSRLNEAGLKLSVDQKRKRVFLQREGTTIAEWSFQILQQRLQEKLSEVVFVSAESRGSGANEEFRFRKVTYCRSPDLQRFLRILQDGDIVLELRMHIKPTGGARNHGSAFRIRKHRIQDLYRIRSVVRPTAVPADSWPRPKRSSCFFR